MSDPPSSPRSVKAPDIAEVYQLDGPGSVVAGIEAAKRPKLASIDLADAITEASLLAKANPVPTGLAAVDEQLGGGFFSGELVMVQAGPGAGKTTLCLLMQCHGVSATRATALDRSGLYVTTEMTPEELQARRACQVLATQGVKASWRTILRGHVPLATIRAATAQSGVRVLPLRPSATAVDLIKAEALALADRDGAPPVIVVDYLQALTLGTAEERRLAVGQQAYALKELAQELRTVVVMISSIGRVGYGRREARESENPLDFLAYAKEAGEAEYASAVVIHLDVRADKTPDGWRMARFIVCKSRFGELGIVGLRFHGASGLFAADPAAGLTELQRDVYAAIRSGATSRDTIGKAVNRRGLAVAEAIGVLVSRGLVSRGGAGRPITVLQEIDVEGR